METNILLESGTNELELLEFSVNDKSFGINIAKVSEIMMNKALTPIPSSPPEIEGVFMPRDKLITVVDLHKVLQLQRKEGEDGLLIVCQFNQMDIAFHVSNVKGIQRISWTDIEKPPAVANTSSTSIATGIAKINGNIILILDFEKIVSDLNSNAGFDTTGLDSLDTLDKDYSSKRVIVAEDSPFLNTMIVDTLGHKGLHNIMAFPNGAEAWEYIRSHKGNPDILKEIACVVTDIEMPLMDGHHLTKLIKDDNELKVIPVILFSSLIDERMRLKGESVGADYQFSKPQITLLVEQLMKILEAQA